jgi:hypothetical protein
VDLVRNYPYSVPRGKGGHGQQLVLAVHGARRVVGTTEKEGSHPSPGGRRGKGIAQDVEVDPVLGAQRRLQDTTVHVREELVERSIHR